MITQKQRVNFHKYYIENRERWKKYRKPLKTREEKLQVHLSKREWKRNHPEVYIWSNAKYRSKKENIEFNLDVSDIVIPIYCPYLGLKLTSEKGSGHLDNLMSLDKIDPKKGYVKGNVEVISYKANRMKNDASIIELVEFAKNILKLYVKNTIS